MSEHKRPTEYPEAVTAEPTYQTGSTKPPKSHQGIIAFVLSAVIFLCGISTILSLMRINLLNKWNTQAENRMCQASFVTTPAFTETDSCQFGIQGQTLPDFWQDYHALPEGVLITYAQSGRTLQAGDILLKVNGQPVTCWEDLLSLLDKYPSGDQVTVTVHRGGINKQLRFIIER